MKANSKTGQTVISHGEAALRRGDSIEKATFHVEQQAFLFGWHKLGDKERSANARQFAADWATKQA